MKCEDRKDGYFSFLVFGFFALQENAYWLG